jgi:uncharacterized Zn finger protein (UPF0148 family)
MATHWHHDTAPNRCPHANDPGKRIRMDGRGVDCPVCLAALATFKRATDETQKSAPAVTRRMPVDQTKPPAPDHGWTAADYAREDREYEARMERAEHRAERRRTIRDDDDLHLEERTAL